MDHGAEVICFFVGGGRGGILTTQPGDLHRCCLGDQDVSIGVRGLGGGYLVEFANDGGACVEGPIREWQF
jgi:hypothetical protein